MANPPSSLSEVYEAATEWAAETAETWQQTLKIVDRNNRLIPLVANDQQLAVLYWAGCQHVCGLPVRVQILKARRMGISTAITALGFTMMMSCENYPVLAIAHDTHGTQTLRRMSEVFWDEWPGEKPGTVWYNRGEIELTPPHRSRYRFRTAGGSAGKKGGARSAEVTFLHISEEAWIDSADDLFSGLIPTVPDKPGSFIFEESTANGAAGQFYDRWGSVTPADQIESIEQLDGRLGLFFSWLPFREYRKAVPKHYSLPPLEDAELVLRELGADDEQLYWRRREIADTFNGDEDRCGQEYPATPQEAFISSGRPAIPAAIVAHHEATAKPGERVRLVRDDGGMVVAEPWAGTGPSWEVWREPVEHHQYAVAGDVAKGLLADPADPTSDPDYHAATVLDRTDVERVAEWHGRGDTDLFGRELRLAADWYNQAWAAPDVTGGYGVAALPAFRGYPRLFQRHGAPDEIEDRELARYGVVITLANRDNMIDAWIAACRPEAPHGFAGKVRTYSGGLADEERSFVWKKSGKREHLAGHHDDILWSAIIAWHLHENCPLRRPEPKEIFDMRRAIQVQGLSALARVGVRDPGIIEDDDDDY